MSMGVVHGNFPRKGSQDGSGVAGGGEPPYDDAMEKRVEKLEEIAQKTADRLSAIEQNIAVIKAESSHFSTREDVANAKNSIIMWVVSAIFLAQLLPALLKKFGV